MLSRETNSFKNSNVERMTQEDVTSILAKHGKIIRHAEKLQEDCEREIPRYDIMEPFTLLEF
jgi:hypothetical protein